ncbi:MAG: ABC transporter substrate-binding protein [Clostridia bacterium]|nr:ABC transporter substrate-binding protein [Clostridia bacterium]
MKKTLSILLALMLALGLLAPAMAESERSGGTLIAWLGGDPTSFNPDGAMDDFSLMTMENVFNKLIKFDYAGNLIPDLAASWEVSEDGLTYTFHLVTTKWHDGEEFTADDVLWTLDTIKVYGITGYAFADVTAEKTDDHTVVLTLTQPDASLLYNLSYYGAAILPKHLYDGQDFYACDAAIAHPVGTGPYKFVEHQQGVSVTLAANLDYFGEIAQTDNLIFSIIPDANTAVQAFYNGELDYLGAAAPPTEYDNLRAQGNLVYEQPFASRYYIAFNLREGAPATDLALRQAIAYGADRQAILDKALMGSGAIAEGFAPAAIAWAYNGEDILPERDVEKAVAILEEAGYTKDADGYYATLSAPTMTEFTDITSVLKDSLKDIGVNVVISSMEPAAWQEQVFAGEYDLTVLSGYHGPDASAMAMRVGTGGAVNIMAYSSAEVDAYFAAGAATTDQEERAAAYKAAQKVLSQDLPIVPLCEAVITETAAANLSDTPLSAPEVTSIGDLSHIRIN